MNYFSRIILNAGMCLLCFMSAACGEKSADSGKTAGVSVEEMLARLNSSLACFTDISMQPFDELKNVPMRFVPQEELDNDVRAELMDEKLAKMECAFNRKYREFKDCLIDEEILRKLADDGVKLQYIDTYNPSVKRCSDGFFVLLLKVMLYFGPRNSQRDAAVLKLLKYADCLSKSNVGDPLDFWAEIGFSFLVDSDFCQYLEKSLLLGTLTLKVSEEECLSNVANLISAGADPADYDSSGDVLTLSYENGHFHVFKYLVKKIKEQGMDALEVLCNLSDGGRKCTIINLIQNGEKSSSKVRQDKAMKYKAVLEKEGIAFN